MKRRLIRIAKVSICFFVAVSSIVFAAARSFTLNVDDWARPRSGERILSFPALRDFAAVWSTMPTGSVVEIRYPGGEEGSLWASELSDWLVALGIASEHIRLTPGYAWADRIALVIIEPRR